jgi:hypothetical protein
VNSFFIAESDSAGTSWRFLDGSGLKGDVGRLRQLIPDWPEELELRKVAAPVWK